MVPQLVQAKEQLENAEVGDRYDTSDVLGEGTYGKVVLVRCRHTDNKLALKQLNKSRVSFKDYKREFNYSYFLSAHPNVVTTYTVTFHSQTHWVFVQEFCPNGDLLNFVKPHSGIGVQPTKLVVRQLASVLTFMHSKNICHRDIKPENILLFNKHSWTIKLTDFGLACKVDTVVRRNSGNTLYTPPEVCDMVRNEGFRASTSADVWQTGITMYCLLTGAFPWDSASINDDRLYRQFVNWSRAKTRHLPTRWKGFSGKLLKLFKKLLHPTSDSRSSVSAIFKYIDTEWQNDMHRDCGAVSTSTQEDDDDKLQLRAKEELRNKLTERGVLTKVTKSFKQARINDWIESIGSAEGDSASSS
mgnify:CR=1 FL=1